jgi:hypothetical protein
MPGLGFSNIIWLVVAAVAFLAPHVAEPVWDRLEMLLNAFARRKALCCVVAGLTVLLVRAAMLPVWHSPTPYVHDEFGYLLQADTFASGHLTNPTHPLADAFESPFILQRPTYNAKFQPGQGLCLALGQAVFGNPWFGAWLSCGLLASLLCWALQGWFTPGWALFGTALILPLCTFSYWMNSYWGGSVAAIGGALVFGALPRLRAKRLVPAAVLSLGATVLAITRPFEGLVVLVPVAALVFRTLAARQWAALILVGLAGAAFLGYYNARVTGSALQLPYVEYDRQYPFTSHFNILPLPPDRTYRQIGLTWVNHWERNAWAQSRSAGFIGRRLADLLECSQTLLSSGFLLLPLVMFGPQLLRSKKLRVVCWALLLTLVAAFLEVMYYTHYAAPALAALLVLVVQGFRHLRLWEFSPGKHTGRMLTRAAPAVVLFLAVQTQVSKLARGHPLDDSQRFRAREVLEQLLSEAHVKHVILVRHTRPESVEPDWSAYPRPEKAPMPIELIHNGANIDAARIIWAHDLGPDENRRLREYYKYRTFWLYQPEENSGKLDRYTPEG